MLTGRERLEAIYRDLSPRLWRSVLAFSADPEIASDAVAEAFAQALARDGAIHDPAPWLWRATFKIASGELARRGRSLPGRVEGTYELPPPADHLVAALQLLPENQRVAIVLHDYADRPVAEVANVLGIGQGTVYVHLSRGRRRLRMILEEDHD